MVKYGDEVIERPSSSTDLEYKGYRASFERDDDEFYRISYDPQLPGKLDRRFNRCVRLKDCERVARNAIDLAHEMQVQASGHAAQSGEVGNGPTPGPLERNNG